MLKNKSYLFSFYRSVKSGFNIDYVVRLWTQSFLINISIWGSIFFLEKFIVEFLFRDIYNFSRTNASISRSNKFDISALATMFLIFINVNFLLFLL